MSASFPGQRPYVVLSCAMSVDGYLDDATDRRLILSNEADLDRVDGGRADSDAILVGANTIRRDHPRLLARPPARRAQRGARGQAPAPGQARPPPRGAVEPGGGPSPTRHR